MHRNRSCQTLAFVLLLALIAGGAVTAASAASAPQTPDLSAAAKVR